MSDATGSSSRPRVSSLPAASAQPQAAPAKKPDRQTVPGDLLVGFQSDVSTADQQKILKAVGAEEKKSFKTIHGSLAHLAPSSAFGWRRQR